MRFIVVPGIPGLQVEVERLRSGLEAQSLDVGERTLARKLFKAIANLSRDPFHPGLQSHEIPALTARYGTKVYQSSLENRTPSAARLYWVYGPERGMITLIGLEPHPEDRKRGGYARIELSRLPPFHPS